MMSSTGRKIIGLAVGLAVTGAVHASSLTGAEIAQIENEFGITLSPIEIEKLSAVVYPTNSAQWRSDAYSRIDSNRKAELNIQLVDMNGDPVEGAQVAVQMKSNDFKFGGTFSARDFSDVNGNLNMSTNTYQDRLLSMFNAVGLNNGFKPRLTGFHEYLPGILSWAETNDLPVRGHLLIWPGTGDIATMDTPGSVAGVDYGQHLSEGWTSDYASGDVLGAVETWKQSSRNPPANAALEAEVDAEIENWVGLWDVYEWDVINETLSNYLLQEILGADQMAEWFKIAEANKVSADTKLLINEYQIISAMSESRTPGWYTNRRDNYMTNINQIISDGGRIDRIGFQSRIKQERRDPQLIYDRLEEWGNAYGFEMVGTEFEVVDSESTNDWKYYFYTEEERAQITEEMMTQYFSHPLVTGLNAWDTINDDVKALVDYSGRPTIHGLVWYYLHRIRFNTDAVLASGLEGRTGLRAFKGDYDVTVDYKGQTYYGSLVHTNDQSISLTLDAAIADNQNTATVVDAWNYAGLTNGSGLSSAVSTGLVGGAFTPNHPLASIQNETVRWQSDGVTDSLYRNIVPSSSAGANTGLYQLSMDYLDADFSASAAVSNGSGRVAMGVRNNSGVDVNFRLFFNSGGGSAPEFRLQVSDDLGNNQTVATFPGATLDHLNVRSVYDFDNTGSAGSYQVYYRFDGGSEVAAYTAGQLPAGFALDKLRLVTQTYNGGVNWSAGDRVFTDNLVLRSLGDPLPVFFTVDPISRPDADADVAYTGQTIAGTASNAVSYSKLAGPAWLNIAGNGDLSGTPTTDDIGANSWIVQASNGIETDAAVLHITVNGSGGGTPGGNISFAYESDDKPDAPETDDTTFADVAVQAGDVVAVATAPNKTYAVNPLALVWSGTEGVDGNTTMVKAADLDGRTSYVFYTQVINAGTYTFTVDGNGTGLTARSKLFVLRANSGIIGIGDEATLSSNTATPGLTYNFAPETLPASAIAIESFASKTGGTLTPDAAYTEDFDTATRHLVHSTSVSGSTWNRTHTSDAGAHDFTGAGAVFYEQSSGAGNTPPVFNSDPVIEVDAEQAQTYAASLADNATDGDFDSMNFDIVSGPSWLNVTTSSGALSGTPSSGDLGTNRWKVSVTDGTATNFATLQVYVNESAAPPPSPYEGTNILFIAVDDLKPLLGCYGDAQAITPEIDSLASQGVTFLNAQCQWAVCGPSRASVMTGLYPEETGVMGFKKMRGDAVNGDRVNSVIRPNVVTLQQYFRYNGYRTAATGKINDPRCVGTFDTVTGKVAEDGANVDDPPSWGPPVNPNSLPSDFFTSSAYVKPASGWAPAGNPSTGATNLPDSAFTDGIICDEGIALLQNLATNDTQFFLGVGFKKPHLPFVAPQQYWDLYDRNDFEIAPFQDHPLNAVSYSWKYATELAAYDEFYDSSPGSTDPAVGIPCTNIPAWKQLELIHGYYACASFIDAQIGRLMDELDTLGLSSNTIVVIWGDHGFHLGDHAEWAKHTNLEQASRSPLIIYSPFTGTAGAKPAAPVNFVDIYPTLCELAGLPVPEQPLAENEDPFDPAAGRAIKGTSLVPVMQDPSAFVRTGALTLFSRDGAMGYSYRTERYRYIEWIDAGIVAQELYDYELDPLETINLAYEPGFDGLMYQFSRAMREEMNALALSGGDVACPELQGSPAVALPPNTYLPLSGTLSSPDLELDWADAAYSTYNILQKTNLLDAAWSTNQTDVSGSPFAVPVDQETSFYRVEVSN